VNRGPWKIGYSWLVYSPHNIDKNYRQRLQPLLKENAPQIVVSIRA
jgi:hypothetical protein